MFKKKPFSDYVRGGLFGFVIRSVALKNENKKGTNF